MKQFTQAEQKVLVAQYAIDTLVERGLIFNGMKIGLGSGSTSIQAVKHLAAHIDAGKLKDIKPAVTSFQTLIASEQRGIPVYSLNSPDIGGFLDLTIDGADEIDSENRLIKGGGAAMLREKIVAYNSKRFIIIADESKLVAHLGTVFPLPVEIIGDARLPVIRQLEKLGASCVIREGIKKAGPVITDNGNMVLDCLWKNPVDTRILEDEIKKIPGVVENGFFTKLRPLVFAAKADGEIVERA